ncbi:MAG: hypothetical protein ACJ71M_12325, partial [Nitrososphaeraceae archaeon]
QVTKQPYVKEEIVIKKKPVTETRRISEQVISEKVSIRNPEGEEVREEKEEDAEGKRSSETLNKTKVKTEDPLT